MTPKPTAETMPEKVRLQMNFGWNSVEEVVSGGTEYIRADLAQPNTVTGWRPLEPSLDLSDRDIRLLMDMAKKVLNLHPDDDQSSLAAMRSCLNRNPVYDVAENNYATTECIHGIHPD